MLVKFYFLPGLDSENNLKDYIKEIFFLIWIYSISVWVDPKLVLWS